MIHGEGRGFAIPAFARSLCGEGGRHTCQIDSHLHPPYETRPSRKAINKYKPVVVFRSLPGDGAPRAGARAGAGARARGAPRRPAPPPALRHRHPRGLGSGPGVPALPADSPAPRPAAARGGQAVQGGEPAGPQHQRSVSAVRLLGMYLPAPTGDKGAALTLSPCSQALLPRAAAGQDDAVHCR